MAWNESARPALEGGCPSESADTGLRCAHQASEPESTVTVQVLGSRPVAGTLEGSHDVVNGEASLVRELGPKFKPRADRTLRSVSSSVIKDYLDTGRALDALPQQSPFHMVEAK